MWLKTSCGKADPEISAEPRHAFGGQTLEIVVTFNSTLRLSLTFDEARILQKRLGDALAAVAETDME